MRLAFPAAVTDAGGRPRVSADFQSHLDRSPPSVVPGVDIVYGRRGSAQRASTAGSPALAAAAGRIVRARNTRRGRLVEIEHGNGVRTVSRHLQALAPATAVGAVVLPGQRLGDIGADPVTGPPHLHFELKVNGRHVDPGPLLDIARRVRVGQLPDDVPDAQVRAAIQRIEADARARAIRGSAATLGAWLLLIWLVSSSG